MLKLCGNSVATSAMSTRKLRRESQDAQRARKVAGTMTVNATELVLVRHGETDWNKEHRLQGQLQPGPPLNQLGWRQCAMLSQVLQQRFSHFDAVVSSDLLRTVQTAQVLADPYQQEVLQHPGLRERHLGLLQGLTYAEAPTAQPAAWAALQSSCSSTRVPGGGESLDDLYTRIAATLLDIAAQHPGKRVLIVSHGGALHAAHHAAQGYSARGKVFNCGISIIMAEPGRAQQPQQQPQQQQQQRQYQLPQNAIADDSNEVGNTAAPKSSDSGNDCCDAKGSPCVPACSICLQVHCSSGTVSDGCHPVAAKSSACRPGGTATGAAQLQDASSGQLALLVWNDGHELAAQGMLDASNFGGSSREA